MSALKSANKELKGVMKTMNISDIDSMRNEMIDVMDISTEIQESLGRSYNVPEELDKEPNVDSELNLPAAPIGNAATMPNRVRPQVYESKKYILPLLMK
ncbi:hypothetical protein Cni_G06342 [Canna indica]|uniref:Uncharacterized protein n=1 Tax=Canna indica TaxID=4628 RepID=A0AAQ3JYI7_9LILI|nr:hypothetical protein Cni_G06342 [Canna indica]